MKSLIVAALAFALVAFARYKIFELDEKPTPKLYDKPVFIRQLSLPKTAFPPNCDRSSTDSNQLIKMEGALVTAPRAAQKLPQTADVKQLLVQQFVTGSGHKVNLVSAQYPDVATLQRLADSYKPPLYHIVDYYLTVIDADNE